MRADPTHWRKYYHGAGKGLELQLEYSLSDRIRYYWPVGSVVAALERLRAAFEDGTAPLALISQYLPGAYDAVRAGEIAARVPDLVVHHVRQVLARYSQACDPKTNPERSAS
jgi:D-tagatose-1,6-bisphosphate aldolase subunit GatZ/KbaZ